MLIDPPKKKARPRMTLAPSRLSANALRAAANLALPSGGPSLTPTTTTRGDAEERGKQFASDVARYELSFHKRDGTRIVTAAGRGTLALLKFLSTQSYPGSFAEAKQAVDWMMNPDAKPEDMPPQAILMDLVAAITPGVEIAQAGRDVYREGKAGNKGWAALNVAGLLPIFGYVKDAETFAKNVKRVMKGADITGGRALRSVVEAGEEIGKPAVIVADRVFEGASHYDAWGVAARAAQKGDLDATAFEKAFEQAGVLGNPFEGYSGKVKPFLSRDEAQAVGVRQGLITNQTPSGRLTSEQLRAARGEPISPLAHRRVANLEPVTVPDAPQIPIEAKSHLLVPALKDAPKEMQDALVAEVQSVLTGANGEDEIARILGYTPESVDPGTGVWDAVRTPNSVYTFGEVSDDAARRLAIAHSIARGQEAATWWRVAHGGEEATQGIVVRGLDAAAHARLSEIAPELGSTHVGNEALFMNIKGMEDFEDRLTEALAALDMDTSMHSGVFHSEYIGQPEEFAAAFGDPEEYKRVVSGLTELTAPVYRAAAEQMGDIDRFNPGYRDYLNRIQPETKFDRYLTDTGEEAARLAGMTPKMRELTDKIFSVLPEARVMSSAALAGQAKRGWYESSARAISEVFGPDAPRFSALLASLSPQTSVEENLATALRAWDKWTAAGRPTDPAKIERILQRSVSLGDPTAGPTDLMRKKIARLYKEFGFNEPLPPRMDITGTMRQSTIAELSREEAQALLSKMTTRQQQQVSLLDAWKNNSVTALSHANPTAIMLSGPKVDSFMRNLLGDTWRVTLDTWMAKLFDIKQKTYSGKKIAAVVEPGKGPGYLATSARVRETADQLTRMTGEVWTPDEVQSAMWSWAYQLGELSGQGRTTTFADQIPNVTDEIIASTPSFSDLLKQPRNAERLSNLERRGEQVGAVPDVPIRGGTVPEGGIRPEDLKQLGGNIDEYKAKRYLLGGAGLGVGLGALQSDEDTGGAQLAGFGLLGALGSRGAAGRRVGRVAGREARVPRILDMGSETLDAPTFLRNARRRSIGGSPEEVAQEYFRSRIMPRFE